MPHRALITGAGGFLGNACARAFLARGWRVTALVHRRRPAGLADAAVVQASIADQAGLLAALAGRGPFDALVNCAGRATDIGPASGFRAVNYLGVLNLIGCMERVGIGRFVQVSTTDVYGLRDFVDADESTPLADPRSPGRNPYPRFKILAERAIARRLPPDRYVILRPGAVWGPGDRSLLPRLLRWLRQTPRIVHFGRWGGRNRWPLAHVQNVATAAYLVATCEEPLGQAYNVVDPERTSIDEFCRLLIDRFFPDKTGVRSFALPLFAGLPFGVVSTVLSNVLGRDHPLFEPSVYGLYSVSKNLDFSGRKLESLFARHGEQFTSRAAALAALTA